MQYTEEERKNLTQLMTLCYILYQVFYENINIKKLHLLLDNEIFKYQKNSKIDDDLTSIKNFISSCTKSELEELENEYSRLFIGPNELLSPPWGSVYLGPYKEIFTNFTIDVDKYYKKHGLTLNTGRQEPADHIGLMFAFLTYQFSKLIECINERENPKSYYLSINYFIKKYILVWSNKFLIKMENETTTFYFKSIAKLTRTLLFEIVNCMQKEDIKKEKNE